MHYYQPLPPPDFNPALRVAICFFVCNDKILLLKRSLGKPFAETWGAPGGKIEANETPLMGVVREIKEEIGLDLPFDSYHLFEVLKCRIPHLDYELFLFHAAFNKIPTLELAFDEHTAYQWVTKQEAERLPLIVGAAESIQSLYCYLDKPGLHLL